MVTPTVLIIMLSVTIIALLICFYVKVTQLKSTNTLIWQEYQKVRQNREDEVDELQARCNGLAERIDHALDIIIDNKELMTGTRITLVTTLKHGTLPS